MATKKPRITTDDDEKMTKKMLDHYRDMEDTQERMSNIGKIIMGDKKEQLSISSQSLDLQRGHMATVQSELDMETAISDSYKAKLLDLKNLNKESKKSISDELKGVTDIENAEIKKSKSIQNALNKAIKNNDVAKTKQLTDDLSSNATVLQSIKDQKAALNSKSKQVKSAYDSERGDLQDLLKEQNKRTAAAQATFDAELNVTKDLEKQTIEKGKAVEKANQLSDAANVFSEQLSGISKISDTLKNPYMIIAQLIKLSVDRFFALDKAAEEFRRSTGFTVSQTKQLRKNVEEVNKSSMEYGVNIEKAYESAKALTDVFGNVGSATKSNVEFVALMSANLGVAAEDSAQVLQNFMGLGGASADVAKDTMRIGATLSKNLGVSFADVMKDVKSASSEAINMIGASPAKLMKAALGAKMLGINLNTAAKNARGLLNFDDSINNEMEASVMLGKNINFMAARRLAFEGDIVGSQEAALDVIKQSGDFNSMNVLQREALAKAAGMEVEDISKMLAQEKMRADVMAEMEKDTSQAGQDKLKAYKESLEAVKETGDSLFQQALSDAKNIEKQKEMQGVMTNIKNIIEDMQQMLADIFMPIVGPLLSIIVPAFKLLSMIIKPIGLILGGLVTGFISPFKDALKPIIDMFSNLSGESEFWNDTLSMIPVVFGWIGKAIGTVGSLMIKFILWPFDMVGSAIGATIGLFATLIDSPSMFYEAIKSFSSVIFESLISPFTWLIDKVGSLFGMNGLGKMMVDGIEKANGAIFDVLTWPFRTTWNWLLDTFIGNSPSELGLGIVNGIMSVGGMLLDALMWPFKKGWDFITGLFSGDGVLGSIGGFISNIATTVFGGLLSIGKTIIDILTAPYKLAWKYISNIFNGGDILGNVISFISDLGSTIIDGLLSIGKTIFDILSYPYVKAWDFISGIFSGGGDSILKSVTDSVSSIGSSIVNILTSFGSVIWDAITSPFKAAWEFISNIFGGNGELVSILKDVGGFILDLLLAPIKSAMSLVGGFMEMIGLKKASPVDASAQTDKTQSDSSSMMSVDNSALEEKLDKLNATMSEFVELMKAGKITISMNGRKISEEIAIAIS